MQAAGRNGKPVGFQVGFSLNNKTTTMNSTSHTSYLHSKLFPTMLCQCKFKCIHQKSVACKGRLHERIKSHKWKYKTFFNSAYSATHALRNVLTVCPAKYHGRTSQTHSTLKWHNNLIHFISLHEDLRLHRLKYFVCI
jgi:hypothetical protein